MVSPAERYASTAPVRSAPDDVLAVATFEPRHEVPRGTFKRAALIGLSIVVLGAVVGYLVGRRGTAMYGARSEIEYQLTDQQAQDTLRQARALSTQLVELRSHAVLDPVAAANHMTYAQLAPNVIASIVGDSEVLRVEVDNPSRARARSLTAAVVAQYLRRLPVSGTASSERYVQSQLAALDREQQSLDNQAAQIAGAAGSRSAANPSPQQQQLQAQMQSLLAQRNALEGQVSDLTVNGLTEPTVQQITQPYAVPGTVAPHPLRAAAAGAAAGVLIAGLVMIVYVRRRYMRAAR